MRLSKRGVGDFTELIDVQVTSTSVWQPLEKRARQLPTQRASNAPNTDWLLSPQPSSKLTDEWVRHSEPSSPESHQKTCKREPFRRRYETDLMHPADPHRACHRQVQRHHLTPTLTSPRPLMFRPLLAVVVPCQSWYDPLWSFAARPWLFILHAQAPPIQCPLRAHHRFHRCVRVSRDAPRRWLHCSFVSFPFMVSRRRDYACLYVCSLDLIEYFGSCPQHK